MAIVEKAAKQAGKVGLPPRAASVPAPAAPSTSKPPAGAQDQHDGSTHDTHECELCAQISTELISRPPTARLVADPRPAADQPTTARPTAVKAHEPAVAEVVDKPTKDRPAEKPPQTPVAVLDSDPRPGRGRLVAVVGLIVLILAAGTVAFIALRGSNSPTKAAPIAPVANPGAALTASSTAPAAPAPAVTAALDWARQQLPRDAPVLVDRQVQSNLIAAGFSQTLPVDGQSPTASVPTYVYAFDTPALRSVGPADGPVAHALAASAVVAVFGTGTDQVSVRQAVADSIAVVGARQATDLNTRRTAEQELLRNPAVHADGTALTALQAGQLDLRAATVLAYLANSTTVQVSNVSPSAPEQLAGLPVRSVDVTIGAPVVLQTIVSGLPVAYQPMSVTQLSNGALRLVWPLTAEPMPGLS